MKRSRKRIGLAGVVVAVACLILFMASAALAANPPRSDPFAQQATLTASDEIGHGGLGSAVALSHDGNTALVGGANDNEDSGAAWVFIRKGSTWTEQAKLTGAGEIGGGEFGRSVAVSSDGKTALVGGPGDNGGVGAVWVFTRAGSTWRQRGSKLTGGGEAVGNGERTYCETLDEVCYYKQGRFGESLALSSDGRVAVIGGPGDSENDGAAWVFARSGSNWTQQGSKLTGGGEENFGEVHGSGRFIHLGGQFGAGVALSADGDTLLIGGPRDVGVVGSTDLWYGAAWVFTRKGSTWTQQGDKIPGAEPSRFGASVALSGDGSSALIGASDGGEQWWQRIGEAFVLTRSGSIWTREEEALVGGEGSNTFEHFGLHIALSTAGSLALIAHDKGEVPLAPPPGAWAFIRSGATWIKQFPPLACAGETCGRRGEGGGVALSGDASTALVGTAVYVNSPPQK